MTRWSIEIGEGPVIATAIHAGHGLRKEVADAIVLEEEVRLREEDPHTDAWVGIGDHRVTVSMSRFEVDLNRPREKAIYRTPEDAWGLKLWEEPLSDEDVQASLQLYDAFYAELGELCDKVAGEHGQFVVLDLHSYNHRRRGPDAAVDDPESNPEINVGTGSLDRTAWADVVDAFSDGMSGQPFDGGHLDVRENVRFKGGHMSRWINDRYKDRGCALAIEVKKFYMDEWTGVPSEGLIAAMGDVLLVATEHVRKTLSARSG